MDRKVVIAGYREKNLMVVYEDDHAVSIQVNEESNSLVGNIYIGKVKNIVKNINGAFMEIENGQICYYAFEKKPVLYTRQQRPGCMTVGDELVLQIEKEAVKTKAPVVKSDFSLTGRYIVVCYGGSDIHFSRKISDSDWQEQCRSLLSGLCPPGCGIIVRTNAYQAKWDLLTAEGTALSQKMENLTKQSVYRTCYSQLYQAPSGLLTQIRDLPDIQEIVTDSPETAALLTDIFPGYRIRLYQDPFLPLYKLYALETLVENCLSPRVWMKSGAYLVIEPTEALTVIDVNSGKYVKNSSANGTYRRVNMEAAEEVARQLRLRNLSGMILVDFIDLNSKEDQKILLNYMNQLLKNDTVTARALDLTRLNLMEITRKRVYRPFYEQMGRQLNWRRTSEEPGHF